MNTKAQKISIPRLIFACAIPLAVGALSAIITKDSFSVYKMLERPPLSPPSFIFPIVWTILYIMMGAASYFAARSSAPESGRGLSLYGIYLVTNFLWPVLFFKKGLFLLAAAELVLSIVILASTILFFAKSDKLAGILMIPVLIWNLFALYLNIGVVILN